MDSQDWMLACAECPTKQPWREEQEGKASSMLAAKSLNLGLLVVYNKSLFYRFGWREMDSEV